MKQEDNKLEVIVKSENLMAHTIKLTSNCNKFPKKYRFTLCDRMQNKSMDIYEFLLEANRTKLNNKVLRNELQTKAIMSCDKLLDISNYASTLKLLEQTVLSIGPVLFLI